jgi:hypothetical protein
MCGCETWSLTLTEEGRLRVFENRVLRSSGVPRKFVRAEGEGSTNSVEDRQNGNLGAVAPSQGFCRQL